MQSVVIVLNNIELEIKGTLVPFVKGRSNGPPEQCYPDEGGYIEDVEVWHAKEDITSLLSDDILEDVTDIAYKEMCDEER